MSYGLAIWSSSGVARVYNTSWIPRFNRRVTLSVTDGSTRTHTIAGLDPNTWTVIVVSVSSFYLDEITLLSGAIRLGASRKLASTHTFTATFIILEA